MHHIRFFCAVEPLRYGSHGRLAFEYLSALGVAHPVRAVSLAGPADFDPRSPWASVVQHFTTPLETFDTNIVCGPLGYLGRVWTADKLNIAIVGGGQTHTEAVAQSLDVLRKYDQIWVAQAWSMFEYYGLNTIYSPWWALSLPLVTR